MLTLQKNKTPKVKYQNKKNNSRSLRNNQNYAHAKPRYHFTWRKLFSLLKKIFNAFISLLACAAIFVVPYFLHIHLKNNNPIKFQQINIYGHIDNIPQATLAKLIKEASNKNAFTFNLQAYRQKWIEEPWTNYVKLERKWPNQLAIYVDVRKPFARWGFSKMVDIESNVFTPSNIPEGKWLFLHGDEKYANLLVEKIAPTQLILKKLGLKLVSMNLDERRAFSIVLDNNVQLILGTENYEERLKTFVNSFDKHLASRVSDIKSIDLRYSRGFAVKWRSKETSDPKNDFTVHR